MEMKTYEAALQEHLFPENSHDTIVYVNGNYVLKSHAVISVYDSGFQHGDGVYEGIRAYGKKIFMLEEHLDRLYASLKALNIFFDISKEELTQIVHALVEKNNERGFSHIHMRLQVTRGYKSQTGMHTNLNITPYSLVICADEKPPIFEQRTLRLVTVYIRRYSPAYLDAKIHSCNQLNQIIAADEALRQGADEAIMLDERGFVAETNSTNIQFIKNNILYMPLASYQLPGITRGIIKILAPQIGLTVIEKDCSLTEFYNADEVFLSGTVGELASVSEIDGRSIGSGTYKKTQELLSLYHQYIQDHAK